jgi:hypothetical protein
MENGNIEVHLDRNLLFTLAIRQNLLQKGTQRRRRDVAQMASSHTWHVLSLWMSNWAGFLMLWMKVPTGITPSYRDVKADLRNQMMELVNHSLDGG